MHETGATNRVRFENYQFDNASQWVVWRCMQWWQGMGVTRKGTPTWPFSLSWHFSLEILALDLLDNMTSPVECWLYPAKRFNICLSMLYHPSAKTDSVPLMDVDDLLAISFHQMLGWEVAHPAVSSFSGNDVPVTCQLKAALQDSFGSNNVRNPCLQMTTCQVWVGILS